MGRLKGAWGVVETISIVFVLSGFYYGVISPKPEVVHQNAAIFYMAMAVLGILGFVAFAYTSVLRWRSRKDPEHRQRFIREPTAASEKPTYDLVKESWSPLKKWSFMFAIGVAIWFGFFAVIIYLA